MMPSNHLPSQLGIMRGVGGRYGSSWTVKPHMQVMGLDHGEEEAALEIGNRAPVAIVAKTKAASPGS